jgi:cell division protein FtsA
MTGIETKIGYPNEHMGKSKFEEVKSPMYATAVGLALAGFKCLDEREEYYRENVAIKQSTEPVKKKTAKETFTNGWWNRISISLKGVLIDNELGQDYRG